MNYIIKYNRATNHIGGLDCATQGGGNDMGDHISYYAESACGSLSRSGHRMATGKGFENVEDALAAARITGGRKLCKNCEKAALAAIGSEKAYQDRLAASMAPATESDDLGYVHSDEQAAADAQPEEVKAIREQAEQRADELAELLPLVVRVDLVTPTKGLITAEDHAGTILNTAVRDDRPGAGWSAENEYGETVALRCPYAETAVRAWAAVEGITRPLDVMICNEYRNTGQRD